MMPYGAEAHDRYRDTMGHLTNLNECMSLELDKCYSRVLRNLRKSLRTSVVLDDWMHAHVVAILQDRKSKMIWAS